MDVNQIWQISERRQMFQLVIGGKGKDIITEFQQNQTNFEKCPG